MELFTIILSLFAIFIAIYYFLFRNLNKFEKLGIHHIKPLPIFGNMTSVLFRQRSLADMMSEIYKLNDEAKYVGLYDFGTPVFVVKSPELIKNITVKYFDHFVDHRGFVDPAIDPLFGKNLFSLRGEKWKEIRSLLSPSFTGSKMKAMFKLMSNCAKNFAEYLTEQSTNKPSVINAKDAFTRYTNDVIATCTFGITIDSMRNRDNDFYVLGRKSTNFEGILSAKFFLLRSFPKIANFFKIKLMDSRVDKFFQGIVKETIEMREKTGMTRPDMIQLMMESREKDHQLSLQDMTSQAFIFFLGGFDTSSVLMCFVAHQIAVYPDVHKRLQEEVDEVMERTNGNPTYESINGMEYLDAVMNETLRLYPVSVFLDRVCVKSFELPPALPGAKPIRIEPGEVVYFPVHAIHMDDKYFYDANKFIPERFIGDERNNIKPLTYFPFGNGPRMCIGNRFALLETKVVIFHLLANCNIKPSPKTKVPLKISKKNIVMSAEGGFWLQLEAREKRITKNMEGNGHINETS